MELFTKKKNPDQYVDKQRQQLRTLFKDNEIVVVCAFVGSCLADSSFDLVIITTFLEQGTGKGTGCTTYFSSQRANKIKIQLC